MNAPDMPGSLDIDGDGFAEVPAGWLATIETSLERFTPPLPRDYPLPNGFRLSEGDGSDVESFKAVFRAVGEPWLWAARLKRSDDEIGAILSADTTTLRYLRNDQGEAIGLFEAQRQERHTLEVTYFGLVPGAVGRRLGSALMEHGLAEAWSPAIRRTWLHTCTFDSPIAMTFYRKLGFKPFRQRVELYGDPRLNGVLPRSAAPQIPLGDFSDV